jgi:hypothetical protein
MINVMVSFARIARDVSSRIYIRRRTLPEKAAAAVELDARLVEWRETLPGYLHKDRNSLRQPEFVNKQSTPQSCANFRNRTGITVLSFTIIDSPTIPGRGSGIWGLLGTCGKMCGSSIFHNPSFTRNIPTSTLLSIMVV